MEEEIYQIDVEKLLMSKQKEKNKKPNRWLVSFLKWLVLQDRCNTFFHKYDACRGVKFFDAVVEFLEIKLEVKGRDLLEEHQKYIFVSNHPLGGIDGVSIGKVIGAIFDGKIRYLLNDLLLNLPGLRDVGIPINRVGTLTRDTSERITEAFNSENQIILFPAGMVSRLQGGRIKDLIWKKNFVTSAIQSQRNVIPVYFNGRNSWTFYLLAKLRKLLGIKMNFEMILLPREMFGNTGKQFTITFGQPIPWQTFQDKSKTPLQWAAHVKEEVYKL